jgi:hypothetical protein
MVSVIECSQSKNVTQKMRGRKLRSGVYWQRSLKQKKKRRKKVKREIRAKWQSGI